MFRPVTLREPADDSGCLVNGADARLGAAAIRKPSGLVFRSWPRRSRQVGKGGRIWVSFDVRLLIWFLLCADIPDKSRLISLTSGYRRISRQTISHRGFAMARLEWNNRLPVNVREIDAQHKKLVDMVNGLQDAMKAGKAETILLRIVEEMKQYAASHFGLEERYMRDNGYPEYLTHKSEHDKFVTKVIQVEKTARLGNAPCQ